MERMALIVALVDILLLTGCDSFRGDSPRALAPGARLEIRLLAHKTQGEEAAGEPEVVLVDPPVVTSVDVATVNRARDATGHPAISIRLTPAGSEKLSHATTPAEGRMLAVVIDGEVVCVAEVRETLAGGIQVGGGKFAEDPEKYIATLTDR